MLSKRERETKYMFSEARHHDFQLHTSRKGSGRGFGWLSVCVCVFGESPLVPFDPREVI